MVLQMESKRCIAHVRITTLPKRHCFRMDALCVKITKCRPIQYKVKSSVADNPPIQSIALFLERA